MTAAATVAVVPRERLSATPETLASVLANTAPDVKVICIDSGHSRGTRRKLHEIADRRTRIIRAPRWRSPNEARNLALQHTSSTYIAFVDNDVLVKDGWLDALVACAEDTGAWVVGPLTLKGSWDTATIHVAGGRLWWEEENGVRYLHESHGLAQMRPEEQEEAMRRRPTDLAELHCALVRRDAVAPFDERLLATHEQIDLCLRVAGAGGQVWFEPESVVTYVPPPPLALRDLPYYMLRWSERWTDRSLERFEEVHGAATPDTHTRWLRKHRFLPFLPLLRPVRAVAGAGRTEGLRLRVLTPLETAVNRVLGVTLDRLRP